MWLWKLPLTSFQPVNNALAPLGYNIVLLSPTLLNYIDKTDVKDAFDAVWIIMAIDAHLWLLAQNKKICGEWLA